MLIKNKILDIKDLAKLRNKFKKKKIVLCHGVFDLLHVGHISYFKSAKKYGNILVVSVKNDKFVNFRQACQNLTHLLIFDKFVFFDNFLNY